MNKPVKEGNESQTLLFSFYRRPTDNIVIQQTVHFEVFALALCCPVVPCTLLIGCQSVCSKKCFKLAQWIPCTFQFSVVIKSGFKHHTDMSRCNLICLTEPLSQSAPSVCLATCYAALLSVLVSISAVTKFLCTSELWVTACKKVFEFSFAFLLFAWLCHLLANPAWPMFIPRVC